MVGNLAELKHCFASRQTLRPIEVGQCPSNVTVLRTGYGKCTGIEAEILWSHIRICVTVFNLERQGSGVPALMPNRRPGTEGAKNTPSGLPLPKIRGGGLAKRLIVEADVQIVVLGQARFEVEPGCEPFLDQTRAKMRITQPVAGL